MNKAKFSPPSLDSYRGFRAELPFALLFCVSLSLIAVGLKNFSPGLSLDGLLYASVASQVAKLNHYIHLDSGSPAYSPFFEHPHLFFWIVGTWLKLVPQEDWAVRIPSHVAFFSLLLSGYFYMLKHVSRLSALFFCLFVVFFGSFCQWYSNAYLDGMFLTFAFLSLLLALRGKSLTAGLFLGLATLTKGSTVLAVGPTFALALYFYDSNLQQTLKRWGRAFFTFFCCLLAYYILVAKIFSYPEFFSLHYARHFTNRFLPAWDWMGWAARDTWSPVWHGSLFLLPLVLWGFFVREAKLKAAFVMIYVWLATWAVMYGGAHRFAGWYCMPFLLATALALALLAAHYSSEKFQRRFLNFSPKIPTIALLLVALVQYTPIKIQSRTIPQSIFDLRTEAKSRGCLSLNIHFDCGDAFRCTGLTWFAQQRLTLAEKPEGPCHLKMHEGPMHPDAKIFGEYEFWTE